MNRPSMKRIAAIVAVAVACVTIGAASGYQYGVSRPEATGTRTVILKPSSVTDVSNPQKLAGLADAVFVGRVVARAGSRTVMEGVPEHQFEVAVIKQLKGDVAQVVTVNQQGGVSKETGELVVFEDDTIVDVGDTYLFSALHNSEENWYTVIPVYGNQQLPEGQEPATSNTVEAMTDAVKKQIPYRP